jgi:hypothetical protein
MEPTYFSKIFVPFYQSSRHMTSDSKCFLSMRLWITFLPVALLCGFVEPGACTVDFGASSQEEVAGNVDALEKDADQVEAVDVFEEEDEHRDAVMTNPPLTIQLPALPPLPSLPSLPNPLLPLRDTITATKTLYAEVQYHLTQVT